MPDSAQSGTFQKFSDFIVRNVLVTVLVPAIGVSIGGIVAWTNFQRDIREMQTWQTAHDAYHIDRLRETREEAGRIQGQIAAMQQADQVQREGLAQLGFQVAANKQAIEMLQAGQDKLDHSISSLTTKIEVALEILSRIDKAQRTNLRAGP